MKTINHVLSCAEELIEAIVFDNSGSSGMGGNGGLISRETIKKSDQLRVAIYKAKKELAERGSNAKSISVSDG